MTDEFQGGICSGNWWDSVRNHGSSSPCSTALTDIGSFGWEMKPKESSSVSSNSIVYRDTHRSQGSDSIVGEGGVSMDSSLHMRGFSLSSPTTDWGQPSFPSSGRSESNFQSINQEDLSLGANFRQEMGMESALVHKDWSPKNYSGGDEGSSINVFKQINQVSTIDQQGLNYGESSGDCTVTCQGLPLSFPIGSVSASTFLQDLFEPDPQPQQLNYPSTTNYGVNSNELSPSWQKFPQFLKSSPSKQQPINHLQFSAASINDVQSTFYTSAPTQFLTPNFEDKSNCTNLTVKSNTKQVCNSGTVVKKNSAEPSFKRPRIQTPSPLPTFKVRKEKLGDRITALQQLVSPFGKTDTASVLWEAIEYIKFLHDQVNVLSAPYMKNGAPLPYQQNSDLSKDPKGPKQDLRSRGLCLVPISSTFAVTNETTADFWTPPIFGGSYR